MALVLLLCGGGAYAYESHVSYAVYLDGAFVGRVAAPDTVRRAVARLAAAQGLDPARARTVQALTSQPVHSLLRAATLGEAELAARIAPKLRFRVQAAQIVVDGEVVATLADRPTAEAVLGRLRADYLASIGADEPGVKVEAVRTAETVEVREVEVAPGEVATDLDRLVALLERGTDVVKTHTVKKGETLWAIAQANHMTEAEILAANPDVEPKALQVGEEVNLVVPDPYITFVDTEVRVQRQSIPYATKTVKDPELNPWQRVTRQAGRPGLKEVTTRVTRENGRVVDETVVDTKVLREPVEAVVAIGSKAVAANGTGRFIWPTNGGVVTSPYGWRWGRLHTGVDIGVPLGSPVYAADSGTVIAAGRDGAYGLRVVVYHGNGVSTLYAHLSAIKVSPGAKVSQGQVIALTGQSGDATGPHLHFEIRVNGSPVNPLKYFR